MALKFLNDGYFAGKVGIGTESPAARLHINPTTPNEIAIAINGTQDYSAGQFQRIAAGDANSINRLSIGFGYDNPTDWAIRYSSYGRHEFYTGNDWGNAANTEKMVITSAGNVGIGTGSPTNKLDIRQSTSGGSDVLGTGAITIGSDNPYWTIRGTATSLQDLAFDRRYAGSWVESMRIERSTGNVGIGTDNPLAKVAILTSGTFVLNSNGNDYSGVNIQMKTTNTAVNAIGSGIVWNKGASSRKVAAITNYIYGDADQSGLNFYVQPTSSGSSAVLTEAMRITNTGGISFGSTGTAYGTSGQILKSNGNASPTWIDGSAIPGVPAGSGTLNTVAMWTPDGDTLGNSIITQPSTGVVRVSGNSVYFSVTDTSAAARNIDIGHWVSGQTNIESQGGTLSIGTQSNHNIVFETNGSTKATILSGGNVGINTTSPQSKLQVAYPGNVNGGSMLLGQGGSGTSKWSFLAGTHYNQASGSGNGAGSAGVALIGSFANSTTNVVYIGGGPYEINAATQIKFYTNSTNLSTQGGTHVMNIANDGGIRFNTYDGTNKTGTPTYLLGTDASGNIVKTTTIPGSAAGPYLPLAGGTMTGTGSIVMPDNFKLQLGNGIFSIFNDGTYSIIRSANEPLLIDSNGITFRGYAPYDTLATITSSGISIKSALLSNQENTDVDTGTETVASVAVATYTAAFFDFVIKKTTNVRSGTVYACHDGTNVEFTETSTQDLGDTSDVTLSVDISGGNMRLRATTTSDDWSIKSLIRAI
jgi:hypothetical protein